MNKRSPKDGRTKHRLYGIWQHMKQRCYNVNCKAFKDYGGRGIYICDLWLGSYDAFKEWALSHGYSDSLSLDRKDNDGPYRPSNCRWATSREQALNTRKVFKVVMAFGETKSLADWAADSRCLVHVSTINGRLKRGWKPEKAITQPTERMLSV